MAFTKQDILRLLSLVDLTKEQEIDCGECLKHLAELAEQALASKPTPEALKVVEHHLTVCSECQEEYEALQQALTALSVAE